MSVTKPYIDVLIIVPLAEELDSLFKVFKYEADFSDTHFQISKLKSPKYDLSIYMIKLKEQGNSAARDACSHALDKFSVGLIICYGIAGALKKDVRLADVCVSHEILDITDQGKLEETNKSTSIAHNVKHLAVDRSLCTRLAFLCENPEYKSLRVMWEEACLEAILSFESDYPLEYNIVKEHIREETQVFFGPIVSYIVLASETFARTFTKSHRNTLAVETESSGAFEIANRNDIPIITIRGMSDYADKEKNKLELDTGGKVRYLAAENAANYIKYQLMNPTILSFLKDRKKHILQNKTRDLFEDGGTDSIERLLVDIEEEIDIQLRENCPAYVHKRKGSILPTPRLKKMASAKAPENEQVWDAPQELAKVAENYDRLTISLEPTYPDRALPWVIADNILRTNGERLFIPIVVDGTAISPKRFAVAKLEKIRRIRKLGIGGAIPVIIADDPDLQSNTRSKALIEEADNEPSVKFIAVSRKFSAPLLVERFVQDFGSVNFEISSFSLDSLSTFLSNNFEFDSAQSAVLATRLNETFERFHMRAHPSYFAGISPEILAGLISANRRNELIQLAVDGALMIMVAADLSDVHVSRRWRKDFLKNLILKQYIEKETVDEACAVSIAKEMAENRDIEISAIEFVHSFVAAGILEFVGSGVRFILVYVRDYLIAELLYEKPELAKKYFDFDRVGSNFTVLDIYSELGPSVSIVDEVMELVEGDIKSLDGNVSGAIGCLESDAVLSVGAEGYSMFSARRARISKAIEYVGENPQDLKRKQKLVDVARTISSKANEFTRSTNDDNLEAEQRNNLGESEGLSLGNLDDETHDGQVDRIDVEAVVAHWCAGVCLLTTGAERLQVEPKRRLASALIALGCRIAEEWTSQVLSVDFDKIKVDILNSEEFKELKENMDGGTFNEDVAHLVDALKFSLVASPIKIVLAVLCDQVEGNVLRRTIKSLSVRNRLEEIVRAVWASDLDAQNAKKIMSDPLKKIGTNLFLKFVLAEHFVNRVYWAKWKNRDRDAFLDVASNVLGSANVQFDREKVRKSIEGKQ